MAYVELRTHSNFSFGDGASAIEVLTERAAQIGLPAFALTDYNNLSAAVRFSQAAHKHQLHPIYGAELTLHDDHHLLLLVKNATGWRNLCTLITKAQHAAPKGEARLPKGELEGHTEGLIALSAGRDGAITDALLNGDIKAARAIGKYYVEQFGAANFWIELNHHHLHNDRELLEQHILLAKQLGVGYVATNNVYYAKPEGYGLQNVLTAIRNNSSLEETRHLRRPSREYYLKCDVEMGELFKDYPQAVTNTQVIADQCQFEIPHGIQELPEYPTPDGMTAIEYIRKLAVEAIPHRYPNASPELQQKVRDRLEHELRVIAETHAENYYLLVWDICSFARRQGIRYNGRGSGANSITAYLLYITPVDPIRRNLVFERFLSSERQIFGDFDIDFESRRRPEIIQYIFGKYGVEHAAMATTYVTYLDRSAQRDVAKAFGIPEDVLPRIRQEIDVFETDLRDDIGAGWNTPLQDKGVIWKYLIDFAGQLYTFPQHLGQHNGGFLITKSPLYEYIPTEPTALTGLDPRYVVQWDKDAIEDVGWVKVDILGLKILDVISACLKLIYLRTGKHIDLDQIGFDDQQVYRMITLSDTVGVFQLDSRAQSQNLPFHSPKSLADLETAISLIRPGPIIAGTVRAFYRRLLGQEPVSYLHPSLESALHDSLGVLLWQEQVALVAHALAGFSLSEGEEMRRSLGKKYAQAENERWEAKFIAQAVERGVSEEVTHKVFEQIRAFGGYAFPHSHAASYAILVYQSAWLKCYYPVEYAVALLNNMQVGFWSPSVVVNDARRRGIKVLPVNINKSQAECTVEDRAIRLGFNYVTTLGETGGKRIEEARGSQSFTSLVDFYKRTRLPESQIQNLILCGAMTDWKLPFRDLLWQLGTVAQQVNDLGLFIEEEFADLPPMSRAEKLQAEYSVLGMSTGDHILALYRSWLDTKAVTTTEQLKHCKNGQKVRVAGMQICLQRPPTAKGTAFLTLMDEHLNMADSILSRDIFEANKSVMKKLLLVVEGKVQRSGNVINIIVERVYDLQGKFDQEQRSFQPYSDGTLPYS